MGIVNYTWTIESSEYYSQTVDHTFVQPGYYIVKLNVTDDAGNYDTDIANVTVNDVTGPTADAGEDKTVDEDTVVSFDGSNSSDNVGIVNYTWKIEGTKYYGITVDHTFAHPGEYMVELNVSDDAGNYAIDTAKITVEDVTAPTADAGEDKTVEEDTVVTFDGSDSTDNVGIANYTWSVEGKEYHGETLELTFDHPETYSVKLKVTDKAGNFDKDIVNVTVLDVTAPEADAGMDRTVDEDEQVTFNGSASSDNKGIVDYKWTIQGSKYRSKIVEYTFDEPGNYTVELTVKDEAGNSDTDEINVKVFDITSPIADAGESMTADVDEKITLDGSNSSDNVEIAIYEWTLGDGSTKNGKKINHTYTEAGNYTVELMVMDEAGNSDKDRIVIEVEGKNEDTTPPMAEAGNDIVVEVGKSFTLDASESLDNIGIVDYTWMIEDEKYQGVKVNYSYSKTGNYYVTLTVTDEAGNTDEDDMIIEVFDPNEDTQPPEADAGLDKEIDEGDQFTLDASNSSDNEGIASYEWKIENGESKSGEQIQHTYDESGSYTIELTVTDEAGNTDTDTVKITVEESEDQGDGEDTPGFTVIALLISLILVLIYSHTKKDKNFFK